MDLILEIKLSYAGVCNAVTEVKFFYYKFFVLYRSYKHNILVFDPTLYIKSSFIEILILYPKLSFSAKLQIII